MKNLIDIRNYTVKLDLFIPEIFSGIEIYSGAKYFSSGVNSEGFYNLNSLIPPTSYTDTLNFYYKERNLAFYLEGKKKINKLNLSAGLRVENLKTQSLVNTPELDYNYEQTNFFPNASLLYEINKAMNYSISYSRKIQLPNYARLDPNYNGLFSDYNSLQGNPILLPIIINNFETKISLFKYASLSFNYTNSKSDNFLILQENTDGGIVQTYKSFDNMKNYKANISIPIPFGIFTEGMGFFNKKIDIDKTNYLYASLGFNKYKVSGAEDYVNRFKALFYMNLFSQINLPLDVKMFLNYSLTSKGTYQIYEITKPIHRLDASLSKYILNKKIKISLNAKDLLNTYEINAITKSNDLNTHYRSRYDSQSILLGISNNFGGYSNKKKEEFESDNH